MTASEFRTIGDRSVRRMGFGAMRLCAKGAWGPSRDLRRAAKVIAACCERAPVLIDTADAYGPEVSEYFLAEHLHPYEGLLIATKGGIVRGGPRDWTPDGRPAHIRRACENSLRRLRLSAIDLYQLHAVDDAVPFEDSVGALADLRREGKIRNIGLSNVTADQLALARTIAPIASVQNRYNLLDREHEPVLEACEAHDITFLPWAPLGSGKLSRSEELASIAKKHRRTVGQVALAWLLGRSPVVLPIPGTHSVAHLEQNFAATAVRLDAEDTLALGRIAPDHQSG